METIHEQIVKWANEYVPKFNNLSKLYATPYCTQSPLDSINGQVDFMVIGINPKGNAGIGARMLSVDEYLKGNPSWKERFSVENKIRWNFNQKARFFLGHDDYYHPEHIDNDERTVWTNLSPFESKQGNNDLKKELMQEGLKSTLDLIEILRPKRIVLLGINAFQQIEKAMGNNGSVEYTFVFDNIKSQVGRINRIPTVCVPHPSGHWEGNCHTFISMFIFLHGLAEITNKSNVVKPLKEVVETMRKEMRSWQKNILIKEDTDE
ncbi:hypothetical protein HQ36_06025 [Porphyromonas gingivicanis]|uniref:Uracil-DNA glycosylase-like domain-containing protein n=1 Tax=Porphyromonas gingivicanis TaxID=266762 RepID=A0A0A2G4T1_9PORP|nr:hypothetical protein [Porphyromonas gingivicanis]KGN97457.1 hypothetical protein HQ36_06025 [Porphyromonas gingivicanis]